MASAVIRIGIFDLKKTQEPDQLLLIRDPESKISNPKSAIDQAVILDPENYWLGATGDHRTSGVRRAAPSPPVPLRAAG